MRDVMLEELRSCNRDINKINNEEERNAWDRWLIDTIHKMC